MNMAPISQSRLKELLHYNQETGEFTRLIATARRTKIGDVAGEITSQGYRRIKIDNRNYLAHRLAWFYQMGEWPSQDIDHINLDKSDNAFANLRSATRSQNNANTGAYRNNKLGIKGVTKFRKRFKAQIEIDGVNRYLGLFDSPEEAHAAYAAAAIEAFGEFARAA